MTLVFFLGACCGGQVPAPRVPEDPKELSQTDAAARAEAMSVAILSEDVSDSDKSAVCGGVWVGPNSVLTAFHCVAHVGQDPLDRLLQELEEGASTWDPTGKYAHYMVKGGERASALIVKVDTVHDMALLVDVTAPSHVWTSVRTAPVEDGMSLDIVGSPIGYAFTYTRAHVGAVRDPQPDVGAPFSTVQVMGSVTFGNSGGPAFDTAGRLVGIADFVVAHGGQPVFGMCFFIGPDAIRTFLG